MEKLTPPQVPWNGYSEKLLASVGEDGQITFANPAKGRTYPRLYTPPLVTGPEGLCGCGCALTRQTSYGFAVVDYAELVLSEPLDPWQRWLVIHMGEKLPNGWPRFRKVLALVARQQGKTHLFKILALYWLFVEKQELVLGTSTKLDYAKESWSKAAEMTRGIPALYNKMAKDRNRGMRESNGEQTLKTEYGSRYKIAASNANGGRSLTINRLVLDELREHDSFKAWNAAYNATNAVPDAQVLAITNQGDDKAVVLDNLRNAAITFLETGQGDWRLGLFEWSAPADSRPDDIEALAQANPNMGVRTDPDQLLADAAVAMQDPAALTEFKTEIMCMRVPVMNPAIDPVGWEACGVAHRGWDESVWSLAEHRRRTVLCLDVSLDGQHASLVAAAKLPDGLIHVEMIESWSGPSTGVDVLRELPGLVQGVSPKVFAWFPYGPAAALTTELRTRKREGGVAVWPPARVKLEPIKTEIPAVCMGLDTLVRGRGLVHLDDPLLDDHVQSAEKADRQDGYIFTRKGVTNIDAAYALAGAVHIARTLKADPPPLKGS